MFFISYKVILGILMGPGLYVLIMLFSGIFILVSKRNEKKKKKGISFLPLILIAASVVLYTASIEPVVDFVTGISENRYKPISNENLEPVKAIVVLGCGAKDYTLDSFSETRDEQGIPSYVATARLVEGLKVNRKIYLKYGIEPKIIVSGGSVYENSRGEADIYKDFLIDMGIKKENIIVENKSKTTLENAVNTTKICKEAKIGKIILVTSALHMDRSVKIFKRAGDLEIIPAPSDFTAKRNGYHIMSFVPEADSLSKFRGGIWEIMGRVYYSIKKIKE